MNEPSTERLAGLISDRRRRLTQLRDLGLRQSELIAAGEISSLLRLLSAKQQLLAAVQATEAQLNPFHQQDPDQRRWKSADARARCAAEAAQCAELLDEVMRIEQNNERQMVARQRDVAQQLKTIDAAHRVRDAYAGAGSPAGVHATGKSPTIGRPISAASATTTIDLST